MKKSHSECVFAVKTRHSTLLFSNCSFFFWRIDWIRIWKWAKMIIWLNISPRLKCKNMTLALKFTIHRQDMSFHTRSIEYTKNIHISYRNEIAYIAAIYCSAISDMLNGDVLCLTGSMLHICICILYSNNTSSIYKYTANTNTEYITIW